jgi:hypothetical protein
VSDIGLKCKIELIVDASTEMAGLVVFCAMSCDVMLSRYVC